MRRRGFGDVSPVGQFPVGSIGDQYQTCVQAGGTAGDCAAAVVSVNPGAGVSSGAGMGTILLVAAAALFFGVVLSK